MKYEREEYWKDNKTQKHLSKSYKSRQRKNKRMCPYCETIFSPLRFTFDKFLGRIQYKEYRRNFELNFESLYLEHLNIHKKHNAKHRKLGFIPLNEQFAGSEGHHIDFECVVYIPKELHRSIWHNVWNSKGMTEINDEVFKWLGFN
jgi:hypothetical protein